MDKEGAVLRGPLKELTPFKVYKQFEEVAKSNATKDALIFEDLGVVRKHTYKELNDLADYLASIIRKTVENNDLTSSQEKLVIGVHMYASDYLIITLLAIWKAGASYLPLDPNYPRDRIEYILRDAKPALMICDKDDINFSVIFRLNIVDYIIKYKSLTDVDKEPTGKPHDDLAIVLYTSGSTGNPKGVCLSHTTLSNRLEWQFENFPFTKTETVCVFKTVITFVDSIFEIWGPLLKGLSVLVLPQTTTKNPEKLVDALEKYKIERIVLVPTLLETITLYKKIVGRTSLLHNLRLWISSGEILTEKHVQQFYDTFSSGITKLCNFYGSTEITDVTFHIMTKLEDFYKNNCFPLGSAVNNTIIYVLDLNLHKCKEGEEGEIYISGLNLPIGYISSHNKEKLINNPYETDLMFSKLYKIRDYGYIQNGLLFYRGRADSVVKLRGYRVDLLEIDKMVNLINGVEKGVVLYYKEAILAFVQICDGTTKEEIEDTLTKKLIHYMVPKVVTVKHIPLLVNGKTDRQLLLKNYENQKPKVIDIDYTNVTDDQLEAAKIFFKIVSELPNGQATSTISIKSNFYQIGGNSLNSIYTILKLEDYGYRISINDFVKAANLGEILDAMFHSNNNSSTCVEESSEYSREELRDEHKEDVIRIVSLSFFTKSKIDALVRDRVTMDHYRTFISSVWPSMVQQKLSFVVKSKSGEIVGISFSSDSKKMFSCNPTFTLYILEEFYTFLEEPVFKKLYEKYNKIMYANVTATASSLTPQENVKVMQFMEQEIIKVAQSRNYDGILTTNTSKITEQLASVYGYEMCAVYALRDFVAGDGTKPFEKAPDDFVVGCYFKKL